jgi:hypothetical protein
MWRATARITGASRERRYRLFEELLRPAASDRILDVGVTNSTLRSGNFFEARYPWPHNITAVAPRDMPDFRTAYPEVTLAIADGRKLPFGDGSFDIGFSNAVIEHVGTREDQRRFAAEMARVCRRFFVATPNSRFPVDPHTLLPFVHWLPRGVRHRLLRLSGNGNWARESALNPLNATELAALFPAAAGARIVRQRVLGMASVLIAVNDR